MKRFFSALILITSLVLVAATPVAGAQSTKSEATITFSVATGPQGECLLTITSTKAISYVDVNGNKTEYEPEPEVRTETIAVATGDVITVKSGRTVETYTVTCGRPPEQCDASTQSGGEGVTRTVHELGQPSGTFNFTYEAYSVPDQFDVYYQGQLIFTTGAPVSGGDTVPITYSGTATTIEVVVTGPAGTLWDYVVACPA
jgi:hypothetical protein